MELLYKFDGNLPFFCFFFLYTMQHERCCWWSRLWKKLQMENWTVQTSMPGICILSNYRVTVIPLFPHQVQFCVHFYVDEVYYKFLWSNHLAKKVVSGSPGLLGFATRLVKSVLNLPSKCPASEFLLLLFFFLGGGRFKWQKSCIQWCWSKNIKYLHANHSFPEWQAVKLTFFAPRGWC